MITTSVVIPSHQGANRLDKLLGCLSLQVADFEWEAIVVLDGSTDASAEVVDRWSATVPVRAIDLGTNQGRPTALNTGFDAAQGHVLIRCDDDLAPDPLFLAHHAEHHRDSDDIGVIGLYDNVLPESPYARAYGEHAHTLFLQTARATPTQFLWRFWAGNCSVSRAMFDTVGPYDTAFRAYGWEDVDWGYRLSLAGAAIRLDPRLEVPHHVAATTTAIRSRRAFLSGSARTRFNEKHGIVEDSYATGDVKWSPWNTAVRAISLAPSSIREAGARSIDRVGDHLPIGLTRKLIALCVESSGRAGIRSGPTAPAHLSSGI
jgi:GT2 family glycosyltransferase